MVGPETADDAGVILQENGPALVQTLDFFPPVVDDPADYGRIVAANSLGDIYAMGAKPLTVMNIVAWPGGKLGIDILAEILRGAGEKIQEADAVLMGGHTMENSQIMYGLSVTGIAPPEEIVRNSTARPGEALILTKPLGSGILSTAAKGKALPDDILARLVAVMSRLNDRAAEVMVAVKAGAGTDVTGFGFLGHLFEIASGSGVCFEVEAAKVPIFEEAVTFAEKGFFPGGSGKNRDWLGGRCEVAGNLNGHLMEVLFDAQTSGGLLFTVAPEKADEAIELLHGGGDVHARVVGRSVPLEGPHIIVR
jgi:selenide,water dikinase